MTYSAVIKPIWNHMKIISIIIISLYLVLPVACWAHTCSSLGEIAHFDVTVDIEVDQSTKCPVNQDDDDCETTCCCSGYTITSTLPALSSPYLEAEYSPYEPYLALPNFIERIFVPPQNLAWQTISHWLCSCVNKGTGSTCTDDRWNVWRNCRNHWCFNSCHRYLSILKPFQAIDGMFFGLGISRLSAFGLVMYVILLKSNGHK